jgi:hypothetical protein
MHLKLWKKKRKVQGKGVSCFLWPRIQAQIFVENRGEGKEDRSFCGTSRAENPIRQSGFI